jgi:hypothetical protein
MSIRIQIHIHTANASCMMNIAHASRSETIASQIQALNLTQQSQQTFQDGWLRTHTIRKPYL